MAPFLVALLFAAQAFAQVTTPPPTAAASSSFPTLTASRTSGNRTTNGTITSGSSVVGPSDAPDVYLNVPQLSVGRIELDVEDLSADINLAANVASLVSINAGVQVGIKKVNITITDVDAQLQLVVRLGHLVDIVNRVFSSLDLNPLLISTINSTTSLLGEVVGAVDGLLGSITQGGSTLNFLVDNLGNIVQEVTGGAGGAVQSIVGNYLNNMTFTGQQQSLGNGLTQKTYSYSPLSALVNIVFNTAGQVVQATVAKSTGGGGTSSSIIPSATSAASSVASSAASSAASVTSAAASTASTAAKRGGLPI